MLYVFQAVSPPSSGAQKLYTQHRVYAKHGIYPMLCVQFLSSWWWRRNRLNVASCWLYLKEYINYARSHERQIYCDEVCINMHTGSCTNITVFWEETLVKVVNGSTSHTSSAMTMSSLAQLLDNYIHTVKQRHITAKHKPACVWYQWDRNVWQSQRKRKNPVRIKNKHIKLSHLFSVFIL